MAVEAIGANATFYVPHSLRHGGATQAYLDGMSLDNVGHLGRWRSLTTARRYIQTGVALFGEFKLSKQLLRFGEFLNAAWPWRVGP